MERPELRPRAAWEVNRPVWARKLRARLTVLGAAPVAAPSARTVPGTPVRSASAIPKVAAVHRLAGRAVAGTDTEVRETTTVPTANWAAPVSSSQPTPASVAASWAAVDMRAAMKRSGRGPSFSRVCRTLAEPRSSHRIRRRCLATRTSRSPFWSVAAKETETRVGSTAATPWATRSVSTFAPIVRLELIVWSISYYCNEPYYCGGCGATEGSRTSAPSISPSPARAAAAENMRVRVGPVAYGQALWRSAFRSDSLPAVVGSLNSRPPTGMADERLRLDRHGLLARWRISTWTSR